MHLEVLCFSPSNRPLLQPGDRDCFLVPESFTSPLEICFLQALLVHVGSFFFPFLFCFVVSCIEHVVTRLVYAGMKGARR